MSRVTGASVLELADQKAWGELTGHEQEEYSRWLAENPPGAGHNLYLLIRQALHYRRRSSSETMRAVRGADSSDDGS